MHSRLNITLPEDVLARADAFAKRERYTRSGLIAAALDAFVAEEAPPIEFVRETSAVYAPEAVGLNPAIRPLVPAIVEACRRNGATYAALVGSSTQPDPAVTPRDVDLLVRFEPGWEGHAARYFALKEELELVTGRTTDLIEVDAVRNSRLRAEFERTKVVLYEGA